MQNKEKENSIDVKLCVVFLPFLQSPRFLLYPTGINPSPVPFTSFQRQVKHGEYTLLIFLCPPTFFRQTLSFCHIVSERLSGSRR